MKEKLIALWNNTKVVSPLVLKSLLINAAVGILVVYLVDEAYFSFLIGAAVGVLVNNIYTRPGLETLEGK